MTHIHEVGQGCAVCAGWSFAEAADQARALIDQYGVAIQHVTPGCGEGTVRGPLGFAYTVGLTAIGHPELIVIGLDPVTAQEALNTLASQVRGGRRLRPGDRRSRVFGGGHKAVIAGPVTERDPYEARAARAVYPRRKITLYQVVYPDAGHRFPWDPGYDMPVPLLAPAPEVTP